MDDEQNTFQVQFDGVLEGFRRHCAQSACSTCFLNTDVCETDDGCTFGLCDALMKYLKITE